MSGSAVTAPATPERRRDSLAGGRPSIRVVRVSAPPSRAPFIVAVVVVLSLGLGALLLLNTLLAQGSFTLHTLNSRVSALSDREQALQQRASALAAPHHLASRARELGMVPVQNPAFLRSDTGKILGEPVPAATPAPPPPVVDSTDSTDSTDGSSGGAAADGSDGRGGDDHARGNDRDGGADR